MHALLTANEVHKTECGGGATTTTTTTTKNPILKLMYLHPNWIQIPHYQVIGIVIASHEKYQVNELRLHWSQP